MISLRNDIYARLVLSAQKFKTQQDSMTPSSQHVPQSATSSIAGKISLNHKSSLKKGLIRMHVEKIDEKVNRLLDNPQLKSLQRQLEQLTIQFHKLRATANKDDVLRIENKILFLERLLTEKSYI